MPPISWTNGRYQVRYLPVLLSRVVDNFQNKAVSMQRSRFVITFSDLNRNQILTIFRDGYIVPFRVSSRGNVPVCLCVYVCLFPSDISYRIVLDH